ncbi:hypothetical protein BDQ12DRAFT_703030 [Crucibulum laeve]|uniref:Autophagy-related protein 2 n=1 Tax=Crucibulum laeve TaxID=68775 RepID=A0A5C3MAT1_9AGAR|nr:hypothetical protein BDQ12DRAFT_703030 [Crucibulum laeve]
MSSWYTSWLPGLPSINFSISSAIQGRFISFILKKTLGHLLKPGQLDAHQIDSQIGSGTVQVNDLELNDEAINPLLVGLPITLYTGSISSVTARIPWPNPLTSTLGFSVKSLRLTFHLTSTHISVSDASINLADSVASVAESFVQEGLSPGETETLWQSFHSNLASSQILEENNVPGGLDPFLTLSEEDSHAHDVDPAGVSVFATLIERLLARFEFDAEDIRVTLVDPENMSITASFSNITYKTGSGNTERSSAGEEKPIKGQIRTLSVSGFSISSRPLQSARLTSLAADALSSNTPIAHDSPRSASPGSSSSSMDEEIQFSMSQSLAFLPPRAPSPANSVASSMYQSAISTSPEEEIPTRSIHMRDLPATDTIDLHEGSVDAEDDSSSEQWLLSFGSSPIIIQLLTPSPSLEGVEDAQAATRNKADQKDALDFSVSIGVVACALRAWQVCGLIKLANRFSTNISKPSPAPKKPGPPAFDMNYNVNISMRGFVLLLLPSPRISFDGTRSIETFFNHPLVPPRLSHGYVRVYLEGFSACITSSGTNIQAKPKARRINFNDTAAVLAASLSLKDLNVFLFESPSSEGERDMTASPFLFVDPHLPAQYDRSHIHPDDLTSAGYSKLPSFEILDWTDKRHGVNGTRLSLWRTKARYQGNKLDYSSRSPPNLQGIAPSSSSPRMRKEVNNSAIPLLSSTNPAVSVTLKRPLVSAKAKSGSERAEIEATVAPIHICVDLMQILANVELDLFLNEATAFEYDKGNTGDSTDSASTTDAEDTPPATPRARNDHERENERQRLERLVLEDLDLDYDYRGERKATKASKSRPGANHGSSQLNEAGSMAKVSLSFSIIRIQARCPPPLTRSPRSGALIVDLHNIRLANQHFVEKPTTRFATAEPFVSHASAVMPSAHDGDLLVEMKCRRITVASSLVGADTATVFLSAGSLSFATASEEFHEQITTPPQPLEPRLSVTKSKPASSVEPAVMAFTIDIPSVHVEAFKHTFDGVQYWADDVTQLLERAARRQSGEDDTENGGSRDTSLIGSRFFAKSRAGSGSGFTTSPGNSTNETVVKFLLSEAVARIMLPRSAEGTEDVRPFDILASDLDALIELRSEGLEKTVITLGVMDLQVKNTPASGSVQTYLSLTSPPRLASLPRPLVKLRFTSVVIPETLAKETRVKLTLCGFTCNILPDIQPITDLQSFVKSPPGVFESVVPSERTCISLKIRDGSVRAFAPKHPGALVCYIDDLDFDTNIVGDSSDTTFYLLIPGLSILAIDDVACVNSSGGGIANEGVAFWKIAGYALLTEVADLSLKFYSRANLPGTQVTIDRTKLEAHLCADSLSAVTAFISDLSSAFGPPPDEHAKAPTTTNHDFRASITSCQSHVYQVPEVGPPPDMINDDLPNNLDYLDDSFGSAAGLRELRDDDLEEFDVEDEKIEYPRSSETDPTGITSRIGGETIKILQPSIKIVEDYFDTLPPDVTGGSAECAYFIYSKMVADIVRFRRQAMPSFRLRVSNADVTLHLYDGYDWAKTRKTIEEEVREMRRRLAKIRQLVASGQVQDPSVEDTSAVLFNSVYIGLEQDVDTLEPGALIAAIDEELKEDFDTASQSSWQSLRPTTTGKSRTRPVRMHGRRLTRSKGPSIDFCLLGTTAAVDQYGPEESLVSRTFVTVTDLEILDHIKSSTWKKFLTALRSDSRGNIRESESDMVKIELRNVRPVPGHPSEEARLKAKILPLRLYVDQDAVDFLKKFFSFQDLQGAPSGDDGSSKEEAYIQHAEIFPIDLKLDYKPRRVDYKALREGRTIELMNFFHFDGAEMTLRHITLSGITGWARLFEMLNDLWTPDVKATQLAEVISGVAPIRSVVNVGSGVADLVLLPIAQYKKDGRIVRGIQKGATAFVKSTAMEAIKVGARLATGTQVILEQAEGVLGGQFNQPMTAEPVSIGPEDDFGPADLDEDDSTDLFSKYAQQPSDLQEGMQSAYHSLRKNLNSAAQTILAVPMEVYERSGNEGPVRSVIRAVPIAVLKPMIGASEAFSKALLGLHNTLDPNVRHENEAKYKHR